MAEDGGDDSSVGDRNTKKVRFKDLNPDVENDMVVDSPPVQEASWRDKVLGIGTDDSRGEEGFEFLEGDLVKSSVNGILTIVFLIGSNRFYMMVWIRLPGLLGFLYKRKILEEIGGVIGTNEFKMEKEKTKEPSPELGKAVESSELGKAVESSESFGHWMLVERRTRQNSRAR
ncbi:hypothetical protein Gogos_009281 [Gossypium gossypioides]|uniref:Uncharacterized protein n=1 Tax=Gossypium gossypioides TaxID=34282 RepID=A0A7J9CE47_GOSGO|nr:hypothetical protein [Gossypium gossypioides]